MGAEVTDTCFGKITIDGREYEQDVVVYQNRVISREKYISKNKHGTSHKFSADEMKRYPEHADPNKLKIVVVGTGHYGRLSLLEETKVLLGNYGIEYIELKTPEAVKRFKESDKAEDEKLGIFHVTC